MFSHCWVLMRFIFGMRERTVTRDFPPIIRHGTWKCQVKDDFRWFKKIFEPCLMPPATKIRPRHPLASCRCFFSTTSEAARRPDSSAPCTVDGNVSLVPSPAKCKAPRGEAKVRRSREELPTAWTKNTKCGQAVRGVWQQKWWWLHRSSPKKLDLRLFKQEE